MKKSRLLLLITRHLDGKLSPEEANELNAWADQGPSDNRRMLDRITNEQEVENELKQWRNIDPAKGYSQWMSYMTRRRGARIRRIAGWSVAASLLAAVAIIQLIRKSPPVTGAAPTIAATEPTVQPGRNTATLVLASGQKVLLDSAGTGNLAIQGNARVIKLDNGSLSYSETSGKEEPVVYNVLTTPRSGQYQLILPDGSHVWLNNVSSIKYPTSFRGNNRTVELTGEGYFEISKDPTKPFFVKANGQEVEVLGTSFNIKAYPDEAIAQTTLLTGAVRVRAGSSAVQMRPDEQALWSGSGALKVLKDVQAQEVISWKNGFFYFGHASLKEVMMQIARWYDVDVKYEGAAPNPDFGGKIDRSLPLSELLKYLEKNQVHFRLEGRTIIVLSS